MSFYSQSNPNIWTVLGRGGKYILVHLNLGVIVLCISI